MFSSDGTQAIKLLYLYTLNPSILLFSLELSGSSSDRFDISAGLLFGALSIVSKGKTSSNKETHVKLNSHEP